MQSLNKVKSDIRNDLIQDKLEISKSYLLNLKYELLEVFRKYTKSDDLSIDLSVKILKSNQYKIEVFAYVKDLI